METLQGTITYPTEREKENHLQNAILGDMLVAWRVFFAELFFVLVVFFGGKKERKEERLVRW